jgi:hypothetical protein
MSMCTKGNLLVARTLTAAVVALGLALVAGAAKAGRDSLSNARASCPVTLPNLTVRPGSGFAAAGFNYGNAHLRAHLHWRDGTLEAGIRADGGSSAIINRNGSISTKLGWWRGASGTLVITGRRLDKSAPALGADVPDGYGRRGFQATGITFSTPGCWQVVGKVGRARLSFVVRVAKLKKRVG